MRIIGIDPGTGRCGYSVLDFTSSPQRPRIITYGCFEYPSTMQLPDRFVRLEKDISNLIEVHQPRAMAIETLLFNRNITTAMQVSEARGVILLCAARSELTIQNCTPMQVKMAVTGYGRAEKQQVKQMVQLQLGMREMHKLDDAIDALAIALTGHQLLQTNALLQQDKN